MPNATPAPSSHPRVALVTGGSRGLGRSTVLQLARRGVASILTYQSNTRAADEVVHAVQGLGAKACALQLDANQVGSLDAFVGQVQKALAELGAPKLNFLVNNAGTSHHNLIAQTTEEELDSLYTVHFKTVFFLTQKLLPVLCDGGKIINISSGLTRFAFPGSASYAAMKGAVEVLTRYLAKELGSRGITVNTVAPGAIETDFSGGMVRDNPGMNKQIASMTALGRVGLPDDVGKAVASLLSADHDWVNAQRIEVSGGTLI